MFGFLSEHAGLTFTQGVMVGALMRALGLLVTAAIAPVARACQPRAVEPGVVATDSPPTAVVELPCANAVSPSASASIWADTRPTTRPLRRARKYCALAWPKNGFFPGVSNSFTSALSGGTQLGSLAYSRQGRSMKAFMSALPDTGVITRSVCATGAAFEQGCKNDAVQFGPCLRNVNHARAGSGYDDKHDMVLP